jgi:hypothetical protein
MTASSDLPGPDHGAVAALCALLGSPEDLRDPDVREAAERALALLRSGAGDGELALCYSALDTALRRAGDARGLAGDSRDGRVRGVAQHIKVAVCPGPAQCTRVERARDLLPAPPCTVNGTRMHKRRLGPDS